MGSPIVIMSDPHFHNWKSHSKVGPDGMNSRLADGLGCLAQVRKIIKEVGAKSLIIGGDLFHVRGHLKPSVLTAVADAIGDVTNDGIDILIVAGNHDQEDFKGGATAIDTLGNIPGVTVMTKPTNGSIFGRRVTVVPYFKNIEEFKAVYFDYMRLFDPDIVLIHQGIDALTPGTPDPVAVGIDFSWLVANTPGSAMVFSGHYHTPQVNGRFVNIGSPYQQTFNDEGVQMGCWVLYPDEENRLDFRPLDAPTFRTIDEKFKDWPTLKNCIVRLRVKTATKGKLLCDRAMEHGAVDAIAIIEREFTTAHERPIVLNTPEKMFDDYVLTNPKYAGIGGRLKKLFKDICL